MRQIILFTIISLLLAGCAAAPVETPEAVDFVTATPGGSVSVSLIEASPASSVEATLTPTPGYSVTPCPAEGSPSLPVIAPAMSQMPGTIQAYLSAGGSPALLESGLRGWGVFSPYAGLLRADRDLTGDGLPEVFVTLIDPATSRTPPPGNLIIYGCNGGIYALLYQAGASPDLGAPLILSADDLTGDGIADMAYATQSCSAASCMTELHLISYDPASVQFRSLLTEPLVRASADISLTPALNGQPGAFTVVSGSVVSTAAGPGRPETLIYAYDSAQGAFAEVSQSLAPASYRIHVIHDADDALAAASYDEAIGLYQRAATDTVLLNWSYPNEAAYLAAYARYRIVLAQALKGDEFAAQFAREEIVSAYALPPTAIPDGGQFEPPPPGYLALDETRPGAAFARMAALFWDAFSATGSVTQSCAAVLEYGSANPTAWAVLNSFGFNNRSYQPEDLCPVGG